MQTKTHGGRREGAGRPKLDKPNPDKKQILSICLHPKIIKKLKAEAKSRHLALSKFIEELVTESL